MKKNLLVAIAAMAAISASAQMAPTRQVAEMQPMQFDLTSVKEMKKYKSDVNRTSAISRITATDGKLNFAPYYYIPEGGFFAVFKYQDGSRRSVGVYPVNHKLSFVADTYISRAVNGATWNGDRADFRYSWSYYPDAFAKDPLTAEGPTFDYVIPASNYVVPNDAPSLSWQYGDLSVENQENSLLMYNGGNSRMNVNGVVEDVDLLTTPLNSSFSDWEIYPESVYGTFQGANFTAMNNARQMNRWAAPFEEAFNEPLDTAEVKGFGFHIGYNGAPYYLKRLNIGLVHVNAQPQDLNIDVFNDDLESEEPIYTTTVRCSESAELYQRIPEITFESEDEDGIPVEYIKVDGPLTVMITGIEKFEFMAPLVAGFPVTDAEACGYPYDSFTVVSLQGGDKGTIIESDYSYWIYTTEGSNDYTSPHSFMVFADVEYPVLQPTGFYTESDITPAETPNGQPTANIHDIAFDESNVYTINVPSGEEIAGVVFATSAELPYQIFIDDENMPSWMEILDVSKEITEEPYQGVIYTEYAVLFGFDTEGTDRVAEIPVSYKNQNITLRIVQGNDVALGAIEAAGNGAVEYFDIQGRKLNAAPANGFFLQKQGNKVTKIIR